MLTEAELRVVGELGDIADSLHAIVFEEGFDPEIARCDWAEVAVSIHRLQQTIMAQSAARTYPNKYRLLGRKVGQ